MTRLNVKGSLFTIISWTVHCAAKPFTLSIMQKNSSERRVSNRKQFSIRMNWQKWQGNISGGRRRRQPLQNVYGYWNVKMWTSHQSHVFLLLRPNIPRLQFVKFAWRVALWLSRRFGYLKYKWPTTDFRNLAFCLWPISHTIDVHKSKRQYFTVQKWETTKHAIGNLTNHWAIATVSDRY